MNNRRTPERADAFAPLYRDALTVVSNVVGDADLISLGGGTMAIEAVLEGGWLWVTDEDDALFGDRSAETGWSVAVYPGTPLTNESRDLLAFVSAHGTSLDILHRILLDALRQFAHARATYRTEAQ